MIRDAIVDDALNKFATALHAAFAPDHAAITAALKAIVNFHPEGTPMQFQIEHSVYADVRGKSRTTAIAELAEDAKQPFVSESYLYNLLGKEDARSLLARIHKLARVLGIPEDSLYDD